MVQVGGQQEQRPGSMWFIGENIRSQELPGWGIREARWSQDPSQKQEGECLLSEMLSITEKAGTGEKGKDGRAYLRPNAENS